MGRKQTFALVLIAVMLMTTSAFASNTFNDVDSNAYYADAVKWAVDNKVTNGIGNNEFGTLNNVTRGQAVTFLWRAVGKPTPTGNADTFIDVKSDAYYHDAVLWAVENSITNGVGNNRFDPDGAVTRGQMIVFLWRTRGTPNDTGGAWYESAENWARGKGLLSGTAQAYSTNGECPRCDVVFYLWREVNSGASGSDDNGGIKIIDDFSTEPSGGWEGATKEEMSVEWGSGDTGTTGSTGSFDTSKRWNGLPSYEAYVDYLYNQFEGRRTKEWIRNMYPDMSNDDAYRHGEAEDHFHKGGS